METSNAEVIAPSTYRADNKIKNLKTKIKPETIKTKYEDILIDHSRNNKLTDFGKAVLKDRYLLPTEESPQELFGRVAIAFGDDTAHSQRLYDYLSNLWFMGATPILSNGGTNRGLPISCFLNEIGDTRGSIAAVNTENMELAAKGGGIGSFWGNLRSIGEKVGNVGESSGIIPFMKITDSQTLAISQGNLRRGSAAAYLQISHPEIEEFIEVRRPHGGDNNRKCLNIHHGVVIDDKFMEAVEEGLDYDLISPKDGSVIKTLSARELWARILTARIETGEPYILNIDTVNRSIPEHHKLAGRYVKTSNLCVASDTQITISLSEDGSDSFELEIHDLVTKLTMGLYEEIWIKSWDIESEEIVFRSVSAAAQTGLSDELYEVEDQNGNIIRCTADHLILTERGYIMAKDLVEEDNIIT